MKSYSIVTCMCAITFGFESLKLFPIAAGNEIVTADVESKPFLRQIAPYLSRSAIVGNKDRYSRSASTIIPSFTAAASTTSAAQVSRRNNDLWYLEQSVPGSPMPYQFGYEIRDPYGNEQYRKETSDGRAVTGSYGYWGPDGIYRHVDYIADHNGYRANIRTSEPGTANENPASVTINSSPIGRDVPSTRRSFSNIPPVYPPPPSLGNYPSLPPAPPSPIPIPTPRYNPPKPLPTTHYNPPAGGKTSNPKPRTTRPPAPIDWSRKTVTQQKSDIEFRKRTSSLGNENTAPTLVPTVRTGKRSENSSDLDTNPRTDLPNNPSSPILSYNFGRGDKPRVRLYATGGPLPGIRTADDQKSIQEMYEFIKSELMAREKLHSIDRIDDENLKAGVSYSPESIEVSSPPTTSPSQHSSHRYQIEKEEIPIARIPHHPSDSDSISSTSAERESAIPISTRFMYRFPGRPDVSLATQQRGLSMTPHSLPLVSHPQRQDEGTDFVMKPKIQPPSPSVSRHSFSLPSSQPDLTYHSFPDDQPKSSDSLKSRIGNQFQPLPVTRSHLIIHSNDQATTPGHSEVESQRLAVHGNSNSTPLKHVSVPMSKRDFTISYPSSYHHASYQFMHLMPRKTPTNPEEQHNKKDDTGTSRHQQGDHPGNELKLRTTIEVADKRSPHVPEVVIGRYIHGDQGRGREYGDKIVPTILPDDDYKYDGNHTPDCKEGDVMHRESTSPQTFAPEIPSMTLTTQPSTFNHPLPQAAALIAPDPTEAVGPQSDPDYMLDDSHEISSEEDTATTPSTKTEMAMTEQGTTTAATSEEEHEDESDEEDDLSDGVENISPNLSRELIEEDIPRYHEGMIRQIEMNQNSSDPDPSENLVTDTSYDPLIFNHQVSADKENHEDK